MHAPVDSADKVKEEDVDEDVDCARFWMDAVTILIICAAAATGLALTPLTTR